MQMGRHWRERYLHPMHILAKEVATLHQKNRRKIEGETRLFHRRSADGIRIYRLVCSLRHYCCINILPANTNGSSESSRDVQRGTRAWTKAGSGGQECRARELRGIPALEPECSYWILYILSQLDPFPVPRISIYSRPFKRAILMGSDALDSYLPSRCQGG